MKMITKLAGAALALCIAGSQYSGGAAELPSAAGNGGDGLYRTFAADPGNAGLSRTSPGGDADGLYRAFTTTGDSLYHPFAVGPGVINLSPADSLADRQWALRNNGRIRRTESRLNLDSLDHMYVHKDDGGDVDAVALPPVGPGNYDKINTDAVEGIDINILPAWDLYEKAENKRPVTVAIIDTGIDITHPDLKNAIWTNEDEILDDGIDNDGNGYVDDVHGWNFYDGNNTLYTGADDTHGTHAAGTISAGKGDGGMVGLTDNQYVKIMVLKALGSDEGKGNTQAVLDAIRYAEANGASICNLSFGSNHSDEAIAQVIRDSKMLFVVAAGNGDDRELGYNIDTTPVYPASLPYDNVLTVANLMFDGNLDESSNYGPKNVDIAAPGVYILSTASDHGYAHMSGTSMAAPMVTGVAAMVYSSRPDLDLIGVKNALLNSARMMDSLAGKVFSGGMLDAGAAMAYGSGQ